MKRLSLSLLLRGIFAVGAAAFLVIVYIYLTLPDVRALRTTNPSTTAFMQLREREAEREGRRLRHLQSWVPYTNISPNLTRAVIVAEDSAFWQHDGIDIDQIRVSIETAIERGGTIRGASTITQQLAKNLYLSPSRDPFRKLRELVITRRLEAALSKARIFEIYLNVVEWGDGIWGAEAAARHYFGVSASALSRQQAALLAGALINPIRYSPARPPARLLRRQQIILARMGGVEPPVPEPAPAWSPSKAPIEIAGEAPPEDAERPAPEEDSTASPPEEEAPQPVPEPPA